MDRAQVNPWRDPEPRGEPRDGAPAPRRGEWRSLAIVAAGAVATAPQIEAAPTAPVVTRGPSITRRTTVKPTRDAMAEWEAKRAALLEKVGAL